MSQRAKPIMAAALSYQKPTVVDSADEASATVIWLHGNKRPHAQTLTLKYDTNTNYVRKCNCYRHYYT